MTAMLAHAVKPGSETDVEGDGAAARGLAHRAEVEHLVEEAEPVHVDLEPGVLEQPGGVLHRHADRVGHRDQVVPAGGLVPVTVPFAAFEPTLTMVKVRCARCIAACASACFSPFSAGTREVKGPLETSMVIAVPFATRPDGVVPTTMPLATVL